MEVGLQQLIGAGLAAHMEESRSFYAARRAAAEGQPQPDPVTAEGLREVRQRQPVPSAPRPAVERLAEAGNGRGPVRILTPEDGEIRCTYFDLHGGGFYMGSAVRNDARNASLADELQAAVVSVDYRLAPENPWPAAPDRLLHLARD